MSRAPFEDRPTSCIFLDPCFPEHPKVVAAGPLGMAMYTAALGYAARNLTDGFIPEPVVPGLISLRGIRIPVDTGLMCTWEDATHEALAKLLVDVELWEAAEGGFRIHDYLDPNPSRAEVKAADPRQVGGHRRALRAVRDDSGRFLGADVGASVSPGRDVSTSVDAPEDVGKSVADRGPDQLDDHLGHQLGELGSTSGNGNRQQEEVLPGSLENLNNSLTGEGGSGGEGGKVATRLCLLLADLIEANGARRPNVTKRWVDTMRLLLERDGREPDEVERVIRWAQDDEFWRANILSTRKLREKYDQLLLRMRSPRAQGFRHPLDRIGYELGEEVGGGSLPESPVPGSATVLSVPGPADR